MANRQGFTITELALTIAIGLAVFSIAGISTINFIKDRELSAVTRTLVLYLRSAAGRSLSGEGGVTHGVSLANNKLTLFRGANYNNRVQAYDTARPYPSYIQFSGISEVVFAVMTATPSVTGNIIVTNGRSTNTVTIYSTGAIAW